MTAIKDLPNEVKVTFRSGLPWRLSFSFSVASLQRLNSPCLALLDYSYFILPIGFDLYFLCFSFHSHLLATAASGRLLLEPWFWIPFFLIFLDFFGYRLYMTGLSEVTEITSTCKSSFSSALQRCSSLEGYSCQRRKDRILIFLQNFGT